MKRNGIAYRVIMLFGSNLVLQLMGFAYRMALSRCAGAYALGLNSLVMQIYGIVVSVCISGVNVAVSALAARTEDEKLGSLTKTALIVFACLWALAALPAALFVKSIESSVFRETGIAKTLLLMLLCIFMTGTENVLKSLHLGKGRAGSCAVSELLEQGVRFSLVIWLLKKFVTESDPQKVFMIMLGMTASEFISVSFLSVSYRISFGKRTVKSNDPLPIRKVLSIAFPAALTAVSSTAFSSVGSLVLPKLLADFGSNREAAVSTIGIFNTVCVPVTMLPMAFAGAASAVLMPEISAMTEKGIPSGKLIGKAMTATASVCGVSSLILLLFSDGITQTLFGIKTDKTVFVLLSVRAAAVFLQIVSSAALNGMMLQKRVLVYAIAGEAYQLVMILLLTPVLGIRGCSLGMAIGELLRLFLNSSEIARSLKNCGFYSRDMVKSTRIIKAAR